MASLSSLPPSACTHFKRPNGPNSNCTIDVNSNFNPTPAKFPPKTQSVEARASFLLQSCSSFAHLTQIYAHIIRSSLHQNHFLAARLVSSCFSLACHSYASRMFSHLLNPDPFIFNAMIRGFVSTGVHHEVLHFYCLMLCCGVIPTSFTFPLVLKACSKLAAYKGGRAIHGHVLKLGHGSDIVIQTALLDLYASCCYEVTAARKMFDRMVDRDVVAWNVMVSAYARYGLIPFAEEVFEEIPLRNVNSWTAMIGGFLNSGDPKRALSTFSRMQLHGVKPDKILIVTILSAIADLGCLSSGKWVHDYIKKNAIPIDAFIGTALIDMYAKSGSIQDAMLVFYAMRSKNTSCYNAMIFGFAVHGLGEEAIHVFKELRKKEIDDVTMIAILTACSHSGLVEEGLGFFKMMREVYDIEPKIKHYGCVIDLLGRAGRFVEAMELVDSIEVDSVVLATLAAACRIHGNTKLAHDLAMRMSGLDPENCGFLVWRANIHAANGEWEDAAGLRRWMKEKGIAKEAGCSWIEVGDEVHWFVASNHSHPRSSLVYCRLNDLYDMMRFLGTEDQLGLPLQTD